MTYGPLNAFKILRNFGHIISSLSLNDESKQEKIESYVLKYCSKSLQTLRIRNARIHSLFKPTENTFTNLKNLHIKFSYYEPNLWRFEVTTFPNLQTLKLVLNRMGSTKIECQTFPALKCFSFDGSPGNYNEIRRYTDVIEIIKLNPQLEKIELALLEDYDQVLVESINRYLPELRCLNLILSGTYLFSNLPYSYHFENVIDFGLFNIPVEFSKIPFTFNKLKRFAITASGKYKHLNREHLNHTHIWDFMADNKDLTSIFLHGNLNGSLITNYERVFLNIEELYINACQNIPIDTVLGLMKKNNRLKKFSISGTRISTIKNCSDIYEIIRNNGIELKIFPRKRPHYRLKFFELFVNKTTELSLRRCFFECYYDICGPGDGTGCWTEQHVKFYTDDEPKCYIPPVNLFYSEYHTQTKT